ncbi:hypothetical protein B296_00027204 [Ensete ventricosum]|uniref:Uncharacterized protein n=1 Tax=Ensete ventricosum TaxID=4639 RepID=A0A426X9W8_ENSVE|nr:hypothetical protein B296_00027204 [Ensete ventricosum]
MTTKLNDLTPAFRQPSESPAASLMVFLWRSPVVFLVSFPIPLANILVNSRQAPILKLRPNFRQSDNLRHSYGDRLVVDGAESLCATGRAAALVLRASWFSMSSCSRAKEMATLSVYGYRTLTSS